MAERPCLIAHRGVQQAPGPESPGYLENTIPSIQAALQAGADVVEIDLHLTRDGQLAVFHDDDLANRTDGTGAIEHQRMDRLRTLDIGYRISFDGGRTFPFRGGVCGPMPSFSDVMETVPRGCFMLDLKRDDPALGRAVVRTLRARPGWQHRVWGVYGGDAAVEEVARALPGLRSFTRRSIRRALRAWVLFGWSGRVPAACRGATIYVPLNYARLLWGWPHRFLERMHEAGGTVVLMGPFHRSQSDIPGIDTAEQAAGIPKGWTGYVQTDRIETIGPLLRSPP